VKKRLVRETSTGKRGKFQGKEGMRDIKKVLRVEKNAKKISKKCMGRG